MTRNGGRGAAKADVDVLIVGAGAAGLSLAVRLAPTGLRIEIVDPRAGFSDDRTFSGFHFAGSHPFESAIAHRYGTISLFDGSLGRPEVRRQMGAHPYVTIPGDLFYATALRKLAPHANVRLTLGVRVLSLDAGPDAVRVSCSDGERRALLVVRASGRFDPADASPALAQIFAGRVVRTERAIFDPVRATLMDFRVSQARGPHFVYVLPRGPREALVEDTYFAPLALRIADEEHDAAIDAWLDTHGAGAHETTQRERGVLPMSAAPPRPEASPRIVGLGLAGGAAKGSTGYAFAFIQRHADALARAIGETPLDGDARRWPAWPAARSPVATFYDAVFLRFAVDQLASAPERVGDALVGLFRSVDPAVAARFLSERASPLDLARVMAAMPTLPFAAAALRRSTQKVE